MQRLTTAFRQLHTEVVKPLPIKLRPYQQECLDKIVNSLDYTRKPAVSLPTGSGKTVLFTSLIPLIKPRPGYGNKTLVIVNRREIALQTVKTINSLLPGTEVGLELGKQKYAHNRHVDVCVASINSIHKPERLKEFDPKDFKMMIIDEAHHAAADSYNKVIQHFGIDTAMPDIACVGVSATFFRKDKKSLKVFDEVVYHRETTEMIDDGHLCQVQLSQYNFEIPDTCTRKKQQDNYLMTKDGRGLIVNLYKSTDQYKSTVIFCINKLHVGLLVDSFREAGIDARPILSDMHTSERQSTITAFKDQEFPVLINCMILTEGTDIPVIDQIIIATPLASTGLAMQIIGRGLRTSPGKRKCNVMLFPVMMNFKSNLALKPQLEGMVDEVISKETSVDAVDGTAISSSLDDLFSAGLPGPTTPSIPQEGSVDEVIHNTSLSLDDIFKSPGKHFPSLLDWVSYGGCYYLFLPPTAASRTKALKLARKGGQWLFYAIFAFPRVSNKVGIDHKEKEYAVCKTLQEARDEAEEFLRVRFWSALSNGYLNSSASWRQGAMSNGQRQYLEKQGLSDKILDQLNKGSASTLISLRVYSRRKLTDEKVAASLKLDI